MTTFSLFILKKKYINNTQLITKQVCAALEKEYATLDSAVETYNKKHSHLSLELSRLQDTIAHAGKDQASLKRLLAIDRHLLTQPLAPLPKEVIGSICNGSSSVYGTYGEDRS